MTERLDEQVGHGVVQVTGVNDKASTKENGDSQHDPLIVRDFGVPAATA